MQMTDDGATYTHDLVDIAEMIAKTIIKRGKRATVEELLGPAWEGANEAMSKVDTTRSIPEQRAFISRRAWFRAMDYLRDLGNIGSAGHPAPIGDGMEVQPDPAPGDDYVTVLEKALDEGEIMDETDRAVALAEWAGGEPPRIAPADALARLRHVRNVLGRVLG